MNQQICKRNSKYNKSFLENVTPIKLTEGRRLRLHNESWSLLTDYYLESVKINRYKGVAYSAATFKVGDRAGQVICVVKGPTVGLLFGLSMEEWIEIENMVENEQQLFYRYFKEGLHGNFSCKQKLFYNFCLTNQTTDTLVVFFCRSPNIRNKDKNDAFLQIKEIQKCKSDIYNLYIDYLQDNFS